MRVTIRNKNYTITEIGKFGREGTIYSLVDYPGSKLVKIYDSERQTAYTQRKVTAIMNKFRNLNLGGVENFIAFPELPVYDSETKQFCGFLMKYFNNHTALFKNNRYDLNLSAFRNENINNEKGIAIVSTLFAFLKVLHKAGFILGDINPDNILLDNSFMPAIVDFDSAQLGTYYSNTNRQDYIDPSVRIDGYGRKKHFIYTIDSDIYAMAIVCYEFMIGIHPYYFQTTIPTDIEYKKKKTLSLIDYLENNNSKTDKFDFQIFENPAYLASKERLQEIKTEHNNLYQFFKKIFSEGSRSYFGNKNYDIKTQSSIESFDSVVVDLIPQSKEDPEELEIFMNQFKIRLF